MFEGFGDYTGDMDFGGTWGSGEFDNYSSVVPIGSTGYELPVDMPLDLASYGGTGESVLPPGGTAGPDLLNFLKTAGSALLGGGGTSGGTSGGTTSGTTGTTSGGGSLPGVISSVYGYNTLDKASEYLKQIMDQTGQYGDPYKQYRPSEAAMRNQTFTDPMSIYNSQPYQLLDKRMQDQQLAQGAQAGTLFNAPERLAQRQTGFMDYLSKLRSDLLPGSGAGMNPIAPQAAQAAMMESYVPLEIQKANAVGGSLSQVPGTMTDISSIINFINNLGGGRQGV